MKTLPALTVCLLLATTALAQPPQKRNEAFISIGDASTLFLFDDLVTIIGSLGTVTYGDERGPFQIVGGYQRRLGSWASAGVTASYAHASRTMFFLGDEVGTFSRGLVTVLVDGRGHWVRRPSLDLYSGLALGVAHTSDKWASTSEEDHLTTAAFHLIPVGCRAGRDVGVFLETGIGWNNFFKVGLSGRW